MPVNSCIPVYTTASKTFKKQEIQNINAVSFSYYDRKISIRV